MFYTNNKACDAMLNFNLQGNIIPEAWYQTIVRKDLKHPKPYLLAIVLLAEIVYWYRPAEVRDENTGMLIGYKKKFKADKLQRSYKAFSDKFGCSKEMIRAAFKFLEELGLIDRDVRSFPMNGIEYTALYIGLHPEKLAEYTFPKADTECDEIDSDYELDTDGQSDPVKIFSPTPLKVFTGGGEKKQGMGNGFFIPNTKNTTKNTTENTQSIYQEDVGCSEQMDGVSEEELMTIVEGELAGNAEIPFAYQRSPRKMEMAIKLHTGWFERTRQTFKDDLHYETYCAIVDSLSEMATELQPREYHGSRVHSGSKVIERINECLKQDGDLYHFMDETIDDYVTAAGNTKIRNYNAYIKSVVWSSLLGYRVKFQSFFERTYYGGMAD